MSRWVLGLAVAALAVAPAVAADDPTAVVKKAIDAHGGAAALDKLKAGTSKMKGDLSIMGMDLEFTGETAYELPEKFRMTINLDVAGQKLTIVQTVNGKTVKNTVNGMDTPLGDAEKDELAQSAVMQQVSQLTPLLTNKFTLAPAKDEDVAGSPAAAVLVTGKNFKETKLYFDKKSGLLVKSSRKGLAPGAGGEVVEDTVLSDYKKVDGVLTPMKLTVTHDGQKFMNVTVSDTKLMEKLDGKQFGDD